MLITVADRADLQEILELQYLCYREEGQIYQDYIIPPLKQTLQEVEQEFEKQRVFLKIVDNGRIIATVRAYEQDGTCRIGKLCVHPDYQNRGIGKSMLKAIEDRFNTCRRYELFTGESSSKNLLLYEKLGYQVYSTVPFDDILTLKYLEKINVREEADNVCQL